jgi:heme-degrading monooxygenase HmoA
MRESHSPVEVMMFARSSSWAGSREALQEWEDHVDEVAAMIRGLPGVAGAMFFLDRSGGEALTLTLWESEEAALVSDEHAEASRAATVAATGVELVTRGRYEVVARF